jgi:membrane protease YdiL (CAAX protease family)
MSEPSSEGSEPLLPREGSREERTEQLGLGVGALAGLAVLTTLYFAGARVTSLEVNELSASSAVITAPNDSSGTLPLLEAQLRRDDEVVFELCSSSALDPALYRNRLVVAIVRLDGERPEDVLRGSLDDEMLGPARRSADGTCLDVGRGVIEFDGPYRTELSWSEPLPESDVRFRARTLARRSLVAADRNVVFSLLALSMVLSLALYARRLKIPAASIQPLAVSVGLAALAAALLFVFMRFVTPHLPGGASGGLLSGLLLAGFEVLLALVLIFRARLDVLGVGREMPSASESRLSRARPWILLAVAPFAGFVLFRIAGLALHLVPSTGEAPIEAFVSWPSGMLSFAALAVVAPLAEEIFFRGFVFGILRGDGSGHRPLLAFVGSWLVFAVVHLPQTWGSWGGALSIAIAALGFTALRAASGSVLVPALAHLAYNGLLSAQALLSASSLD